MQDGYGQITEDDEEEEIPRPHQLPASQTC